MFELYKAARRRKVVARRPHLVAKAEVRQRKVAPCRKAVARRRPRARVAVALLE
jgi:hypothetical protein